MDEAARTRWLTPEQRQTWITVSKLLVWLPHALDAQLERDSGVSRVEYQVLSLLSMSAGRAGRMSDLAARADVSQSHLSRIAARLEKRGWLARTPDPQDRRATVATLTDAGWDAVAAAAPGHAEEVQRLVFDNLTAAQVRELHRIGTLVLAACKPDVPPLASPTRAAGQEAPDAPAQPV